MKRFSHVVRFLNSELSIWKGCATLKTKTFKSCQNLKGFSPVLYNLFDSLFAHWRETFKILMTFRFCTFDHFVLFISHLYLFKNNKWYFFNHIILKKSGSYSFFINSLKIVILTSKVVYLDFIYFVSSYIYKWLTLLLTNVNIKWEKNI